MNASGPRLILAVAMVIALMTTSGLKMAAACKPCRDYFAYLNNRTQASCRCIYYDVYSKDHPQVIADCNNLREVPDFNAICNMSDVYTVNLQRNKIERVNQHAFKALVLSDAVLEWAGASPELILLHNEINYVHREAFKGGMESKLSLLDLRYNKLTTLPEAIFTLVNLTKLYLRNNLIESAHGEAKLSKLTVLDLTANKLTVFPESVCNFPALSYLYLDGNPIEGDLSGYLQALSQCTRLRELTWPKPTVTCKQRDLEIYANTTTCKIMVVRNGNNDMVTCDSDSSEEFKGIAFEWALRRELAKVCSEISGSAQIRIHSWMPFVVVVVSIIFLLLSDYSICSSYW